MKKMETVLEMEMARLAEDAYDLITVYMDHKFAGNSKASNWKEFSRLACRVRHRNGYYGIEWLVNKTLKEPRKFK